MERETRCSPKRCSRGTSENCRGRSRNRARKHKDESPSRQQHTSPHKKISARKKDYYQPQEYNETAEANTCSSNLPYSSFYSESCEPCFSTKSRKPYRSVSPCTYEDPLNVRNCRRSSTCQPISRAEPWVCLSCTAWNPCHLCKSNKPAHFINSCKSVFCDPCPPFDPCPRFDPCSPYARCQPLDEGLRHTPCRSRFPCSPCSSRPPKCPRYPPHPDSLYPCCPSDDPYLSNRESCCLPQKRSCDPCSPRPKCPPPCGPPKICKPFRFLYNSKGEFPGTMRSPPSCSPRCFSPSCSPMCSPDYSPCYPRKCPQVCPPDCSPFRPRKCPEMCPPKCSTGCPPKCSRNGQCTDSFCRPWKPPCKLSTPYDPVVTRDPCTTCDASVRNRSCYKRSGLVSMRNYVKPDFQSTYYSPCLDSCNRCYSNNSLCSPVEIREQATHQCPWEADVTVNGTVRGHCTCTAEKIASQLAGKFLTRGSTLVDNDCSQSSSLKSRSKSVRFRLGGLDDGSYMDFSRNNRPSLKIQRSDPPSCEPKDDLTDPATLDEISDSFCLELKKLKNIMKEVDIKASEEAANTSENRSETTYDSCIETEDENSNSGRDSKIRVKYDSKSRDNVGYIKHSCKDSPTSYNKCNEERNSKIARNNSRNFGLNLKSKSQLDARESQRFSVDKEYKSSLSNKRRQHSSLIDNYQNSTSFENLRAYFSQLRDKQMTVRDEHQLDPPAREAHHCQNFYDDRDYLSKGRGRYNHNVESDYRDTVSDPCIGEPSSEVSSELSIEPRSEPLFRRKSPIDLLHRRLSNRRLTFFEGSRLKQSMQNMLASSRRAISPIRCQHGAL